jgi:hypothetical protein
MEFGSKKLQSYRFKSSEAFKSILKQKRDLHKEYYSKLSSHMQICTPVSKYKRNRLEVSELSMNKHTNHTSNSSIAGSKPVKFHLSTEIDALIGQKFHKLPHTANPVVKPSLKNTNIDENLRAATPEYFRQALYSILKEPDEKPKKNKLKASVC